MPLTGVGLQVPTIFGPRAMTSPTFGSPTFASTSHSQGLSGPSSTNPGMTAPTPLPTNVYGFGGGMLPSAQQSFGAPAVATAYPYAFGPSPAVLSPEALGWVSPASLLAAVAMRKGQPQGPTNDREVEDFIYDALDMLPGAADIEVRCESGKVTLTGTVPDKRTKRDIGEVGWALLGINDLQNNVAIVSKRRQRPSREAEPTPAVPARKQS
jgi:hypothetical protein